MGFCTNCSNSFEGDGSTCPICVELLKTENAIHIPVQTRELRVDKDTVIARLITELNNVRGLVVELLSDKYCSEFTIIDGVKRHCDGLTFNEWVVSEGYHERI